MAEKTFPYAVARVRVLEKRLLSKQTLLQMAEAKTPEDALRAIAEAGYSESASAYDFEAVLSKELSKTYEILRGLAPEENFVDIFLYKNDYHNAKVLIKEELSGISGDKYLIEAGNVPISILKEALSNRSYSDLPKIMGEAIIEAFDIYGKTQNGQMIDIALDKAAYYAMSESAKESENDFIIKYVEKICDLTNLKSFMRVKKMKKDFAMFSSVFVKGGTLDKDKFSQAFASDAPAGIFKFTSYSKITAEGLSGSFTLFEKLCDDYMMEYVKAAKVMALSMEPLVAYLYAKESEIKTVRIIMTSKLNNIDAETIKERLRDAYV